MTNRVAPGTATALTAAGALLLVFAAAGGEPAMVTAVLLVQVAVAATWHALLRAPGERWGSLVGLGAGVVATAAVAAPSHASDVGSLALVGVAGLFAAFVQRLLTVEQGHQPLVALLATTALVLVEVLAASWLPASAGSAGTWVVAAGALAAALAVTVVSTLGTTALAVAAAVVASAAVGGLLGLLAPADLLAQEGDFAARLALVAAGAGLAALCGAQVRRLAGRSARTAPATVAALPLALAAPATYTLARIVLG